MTQPERVREFGLVGDDVLDTPGEVPAGVPEDSAFAELSAALGKQVTHEPVTLLVNGRENVAITFATVISADMLKAWQKKNKDRTSETGLNEVRLMATVIANQAIGVSINERPATGRDGEPLSFRHADLREMLGASSALEAVLKMYGGDAGHPAILATGDEILKSAGYGEDAIRAEDPTTLR